MRNAKSKIRNKALDDMLETLRAKIEKGENIVEVYSYKTAIVREVMLVESRDDFKNLGRFLARAGGTYEDNHTVYSVKDRDGNAIIHIGFSDDGIFFGSSIEVRNWG